MSRIRVLEGETPLLCKCHGKAVMATYACSGELIFRREWHGDDHLLVLSFQQVLDILQKAMQNPRQVNT